MLPQEEIALLESHIRKLLEQNEQLRQQVALLTQANDSQRNEILRSHAELQQLKNDYQNLQTAHALVSDNAQGRERARRQITSLINKIDKTIELLNE